MATRSRARGGAARPPAGLAALGEDALVRLFAAAAPRGRGVLLGPGDDAALVRPPRGARLVLTTDLLAEGVHFRRGWGEPADLGWRLGAANASDVNAMGGRPLWALLSAALPPELDPAFVRGVARGLRAAARRFGFAVVGGDTCASGGGVVLSLALAGAVGPRLLRRTGARPGDLLFVTGALGASSLGLAALERHGRAAPPPLRAAVRRHLHPAPPVAVGPALARAGLATAAIDLSDGLARDLARLAAASGVGARIDGALVPVAPAARRAAPLLGTAAAAAALHGGEEYELLFTARPAAAARVGALAARLGVAATPIGTILPRRAGLRVHTGAGRERPLHPRAWEHFGRP